MGFVSFPARQSEDLRISRDADHPSKNSADPPWAPRSPGAVAPLMFLLDPPFPRHATVADRAARIGTIEDAIFEAFPVESVRDAVVRCRTSDALSFLGF
jgi:hypothetical protein